jgi:SpoVK/Ycf46/Vps4 family AAA+-type ATPase
MSKLAGLKSAKKTIRSVIEKPIKFAFIYKKVPIKIPRGILLYGATGNGKTALGSALKDEFSMKFFNIKGSDILSKYIGGSEAAVRDVFEKALSVSPSIIFFD